MNRRALLSAAAGTTVGVAGCLESTDEPYESCGDRELVYSRLPEDVKAEIDAAFEEGTYEETDVVVEEKFLYELVEGPSVKALRRDGTYYEPRIDEEPAWLGLGTKRILSFEEATLTRDSKEALRIRNATAEPWNGVVTIEETGGELVVDEEITVESFPRTESEAQTAAQAGERDRLTSIPVTDECGRYDLTFEPEDGDPERFEFWITMGVPRTDRYLIDDGGIETVETLRETTDGVGHPRNRVPGTRTGL